MRNRTFKGGGDVIRVLLAAVILLALVPGLLFAAWYAGSWSNAAREEIEARAVRNLRSVVQTLNRSMNDTQRMLTALASSPPLQAGDLQGFHRQAVQASTELGVYISLRDLQRDELAVHTAFAFDALVAPKASPIVTQTARNVLATREPQVSGVFFGQLQKMAVTITMVPINRETEPRYAVALVQSTDAVAGILRDLDLGSDWVATVIDREGRTVAHSAKHDDYTGQIIPGTPNTTDRAAPPVGRLAGTLHDGTPATYFYERSWVTGWTAAVAVPDRALAAPTRLALSCLAAFSVFILLIAAAAARKLERWLATKLGALQTAAIVERRLSQQQFQTIAESASDGIAVIDSQGSIVYLNAPAERIFGYSRDGLIGQSVDMLLPARFRSAEHRQNREAAPLASVVGTGAKPSWLRKDGTEFSIDIRASTIKTSAGELTIVTFVDHTAQELAKSRLSEILGERDELQRRLMQAQERERERLARDLHDQTGQFVVAAMMELKSLEPLVSDTSRDRIHSLHDKLGNMSKVLHRIAQELRPASIDDVGLIDTLAGHVTEWGAHFGIAADFFCGNKRVNQLSNEVSTAVYRTVQEALTNVAKHAKQPTFVNVVIDLDGPELRLIIQDNGCGFDIESLQQTKNRNRGLGLAGMRERLSLIGGGLEVESTVGVGTGLFVRIPLEREIMVA